MSEYDKIFYYKTPNAEKLLNYGFSCEKGVYRRTMPVLEGLVVTICVASNVTFQVTDSETEEPYTLYLVPDAGGEFVGRVREKLTEILKDVAENCFDSIPFHSREAREIAKYTAEKFGEPPDYPWKDEPGYAVIRRQDNKKWYAGIFTVAAKKVGSEKEGEVEILNFRTPPEERDALLKNAGFVPAWHMNKVHWITARLDGSVPIELILSLLAASREIAKKH